MHLGKYEYHLSTTEVFTTGMANLDINLGINTGVCVI